jgi:hypothetical protein
MTANELADLVECACCAYQKEAAAMLRQQALEIQALHQILGYEGVAVGQDYLDECVAELRKAQENEQ